MTELNYVGSAREHGSRPEIVPVSSLPVGHAWRVAGLDERHVARLAAAYSSLPPVIVKRNDRTIVDGAHRVAAARRLGMHMIAVEWLDGGRIEAIAEFIRRNTLDGLAPTGDDRRRGVVEVLSAEPTWSDRRVAHLCGVSPKLVARVRADEACTDSPAGAKRLGRDGRARPVRAGAMRAEITEMLTNEPDASLRTVAARLGVSPETVRSVRRQLGLHSEVASAHAPGGVFDDVAIERVLASGGCVEPPAPWRGDNAFESTEAGVSFVEWFEATALADDGSRIDEVPFSRVYEIADEARRRARCWARFADELELRTRGRR